MSNAPPLTIYYRPPQLADGAPIWELVRAAGNLDLNAVYAYQLLCDRFSSSCVVAESEGQLLGFATAFIPPGQPDTLFVWQVGVAPAARGQGVARKMLEELLERPQCSGVHWIEGTVSPSNNASRALFASLAKKLEAKLVEQDYIEPHHFPEGCDHEAEPLLRLGPFRRG